MLCAGFILAWHIYIPAVVEHPIDRALPIKVKYRTVVRIELRTVVLFYIHVKFFLQYRSISYDLVQ